MYNKKKKELFNPDGSIASINPTIERLKGYAYSDGGTNNTEPGDEIFVFPSNFGWSDLGTWGSLWTLKEKTEEGNAIVGDDVRMIDSKDCIVHAPGLSQVVVQGLEGYIISQHGDRLLVCRKDHEQKITDYIK